MNNFTKSIPPLTPEQISEIKELSKMLYEEIDLSDIPEITDEEWKKFKPARLREKKLKKTA